ncbi:hypothetical protein D1007_40088 [Hordeum vulgare]|nr:hypothetical protein D1007_40088 [Hordeum vulgare]
MSGFLHRPLVVCVVVCATARSGLPRLGTPGSSPSLSSAPADANCVSVSLSMLPAAAMRSGVGAGVVLVFSPASRAHYRPAHVKELKTNLTLRYLLMTCVHWMNGHPMLAATAHNYRMDKACEEVKNKETETQGPLSDEQRHNIFQTTYKGTLQCNSSQPRGYGYMAKPSTGSERIHIQIEEQARATAAFQQRNSELSHQVNDLQDQLQAERANTQEIINLERAEREQLEGKLKQEHAERERLLEAERTSRLKFEKNMMAKFAEFSKQMGTQQVFTNRIDKENSNPNFQKTLLQRPSPNKATGARPTVIYSNALIHASTRNSRMFKAIDPNN